MIFYDQTPRQMLVDLINEANPDMPFPVNVTDYDFMDPVAIEETPEGHNTEIRIIARPTAPYLGNKVVTYRRLHLGNLFQGVTPMVRKWVENGGSTSSSTIRHTLHELLPLYSKKYGLTLDDTQINDLSLRERDGNDLNRRFNMSARTDSIVYVGSVSTQWIIGLRTLPDLLQNDEINDIEYPGGNDFSAPETRKFYLTPVVFEHDFTVNEMADSSNWNYATSYDLGGTTSTAYVRWFDSFFIPFADIFEQKTGTRPTYTDRYGYRDAPFNFGGFHIERITLPHPDYPEANHDYYNSCVVLECPSDCDWGTGFIYIHYNV